MHSHLYPLTVPVRDRFYEELLQFLFGLGIAVVLIDVVIKLIERIIGDLS